MNRLFSLTSTLLLAATLNLALSGPVLAKELPVTPTTSRWVASGQAGEWPGLRRLDPWPVARQALKEVLASGRRGPVTFDADGTLWSGDVGVGFFLWMLRGGYYPQEAASRLKAAWSEYRAGTFPGEQLYELMVTGMAGLYEKDVQRLADYYFKRIHCFRIYRPMRLMVKALRDNGLTPWVVSGSPIWVVSAGARFFGIPRHRVIGLSAEVDANGRLTDRLVRPVPWKEGKAQAIRRQIGQQPLLAAGDSLGDKQMLDLAVHRLVINPKGKMRQVVEEKSWPIMSLGRTDHLAGNQPLSSLHQRRPSTSAASAASLRQSSRLGGL